MHQALCLIMAISGQHGQGHWVTVKHKASRCARRKTQELHRHDDCMRPLLLWQAL